MSALKLISESGAKYVIVGGIAAGLHGLSRGTKDIDLLIPKDLSNTQSLLDALKNLTFGISGEILAEDVIAKPFTIIGDMPRVDLLLRAGKLAFEQAYANRIETEIQGMKICYASLDDLILSKQTSRARDKVDIQDLEETRQVNVSQKIKET